MPGRRREGAVVPLQLGCKPIDDCGGVGERFGRLSRKRGRKSS
jgi:hypothetical protein